MVFIPISQLRILRKFTGNLTYSIITIPAN